MSINKLDEANRFVTKLKADGSEKDECNLGKVSVNYKSILSELPAKDRGPFSLNVLCILCRNLEKVSIWRDKISNKELLELSIECLRQTRVLKSSEQVKTLACVYHIHKHVVKQNMSVPAELMLKLSYMPFEVHCDNLLKEYYKTYWSILVDRFVYIEKLKSSRLSILKLLPKLTEDIMTVISLYDPVQFCSISLPFIVKKLHVLYSDVCANDLRNIYKRIFESIATKDNLKKVGSASEKESLDLYIKFNDCLYVIFELDSRLHFKNSTVESTVRTIISLLKHRSDIFHCLQMVYLNCFCSVLTGRADTSYAETVLRSFRESCVATESLGYRRAMDATYSYIAQLLRLYMEYFIKHCREKSWKDHFDVPIQDSCLNIVKFLIQKLGRAQQMSKCEGCSVKSGLHDALRLAFLAKSLVSDSISQGLDVTELLPSFLSVVQAQYEILSELKKLGCPNQLKCLRKLQTDVHNTAIALNKAQLYEYSIKLFNIYLKKEIQCVKSDSEFINVARALYNKGISELDCKLYEEGLKSAYLSLAFSSMEGLSSIKYMSLVMDIKAKSLKSCEEDEEVDKDRLQLLTVLSACKLLVDSSEYGNLKPFLSTLKFSELLKHEFSMYVKLWPSAVPIAGVWQSLSKLLKIDRDSWISVENEETLIWCLYQVMLETPTVVRSIHNDYYKTLVGDVLKRFQEKPAKTLDEIAVQTTLLFLQSEYHIAEASQKYGWKASGPILDPDMAPSTRTLPLEHQALRSAFEAVQIWTNALPQLGNATISPHLHHCLQVAEIFVQHFMNMYRYTHGLQLAYVCCQMAHRIDAKESYVRNAGTILSLANNSCEKTEKLITTAFGFWKELMVESETLETALVFACELATYYKKCGSYGTAEKLLRYTQARLMEGIDTQIDINLDLAIGRLLECARGPCALSNANAAHRHYLAVATSGSRWCSRVLRNGRVKGGVVSGGARGALCSRTLYLARRTRASVAAALSPATAIAAATLHTLLADPHCPDAQVRIDIRLKHALGLQPTNETQPQCQLGVEGRKGEPSQLGQQSQLGHPSQLGGGLVQLEGVREVQRSRGTPSPTRMSTPPFRTPEFLLHATGCPCYACAEPYSAVLAFQACALEAAAHFRSGEMRVAEEYFAGAFETLALCEARLRSAEGGGKGFERWLLRFGQEARCDALRRVEAEAQLEAALFEMARGGKQAADDRLVRAHELVATLSSSLANELLNCLLAHARLLKGERGGRDGRGGGDVGLEVELEALRLSPLPEPVKTPETRAIRGERVKYKNKTAPSEEVPQPRRRVIRLNLDEDSEEEPNTQFKVPLEAKTPCPRVLVSQPTLDESRETQGELEFSTPVGSTPAERFFTPLNHVKRYGRKIGGAVKNLEQDFATPIQQQKPQQQQKQQQQDKENRVLEKVKTRGRTRAEAKRGLQRATSPGSLGSQRR